MSSILINEATWWYVSSRKSFELSRYEQSRTFSLFALILTLRLAGITSLESLLLSKQSVRTIPVPVLIETNKKDILNLFGGFVMGKGLLQIFFGELRVRLCHDDSLECLVVTMPPKIHIGRSRGVRRAWLFQTNCFQNRTRAIDPISRHPAEWHR